MQVKEKNGYVVAAEGVEGRVALLHSHKALDFLECFANMALFMQYRLRVEGLLPRSDQDIPNYFGFSATDDQHHRFMVEPDIGNLFLINYFTISRCIRPAYEKPIIPGKRKPSELLLWTTQAQRLLLDCVCGCYTDCMVQEKNFAGYVWWFHKVKSVASRYAYELDQYRYMLCVRPNDARIEFLKQTYGLKIYKEFDRSFIEKRT